MMLEISIGEAIDKYTILTIKEECIKDERKLVNIKKERMEIEKSLIDQEYFYSFLKEMKELTKVNKTLWDIEDQIRIKEGNKQFDHEFIELARSVYITNDKRFEIKNQINQKSNSNLKEEKSYAKYI
tara:strand:- start:1140 stop:1520 length:381 start_codon:yes stop_codon:yes gene_type:complete